MHTTQTTPSARGTRSPAEREARLNQLKQAAALRLAAAPLSHEEMRAKNEERISHARLEIAELRHALAIMSLTIDRADIPVELGLPPMWIVTLNGTKFTVLINADHMVMDLNPEFSSFSNLPLWVLSTTEMIDGLRADVESKITSLTEQIEPLQIQCADREVQPVGRDH